MPAPDTTEIPAVDNPYRHDHNPLNADFHGGICPACEWEYQAQEADHFAWWRSQQ